MPQDQAYLLKQNMDEFLRPLTQGLPFYKILDVAFDQHVMLLSGCDANWLGEKLNDILLEAEGSYELDFTAAISRPFEQMELAAAAYNQARWTLENARMTGGDAKIVLVAGPGTGSGNTAHFPLSMEKALSTAVLQGKDDVWKGLLDEIFKGNRMLAQDVLPQLCTLWC